MVVCHAQVEAACLPLSGLVNSMMTTAHLPAVIQDLDFDEVATRGEELLQHSCRPHALPSAQLGQAPWEPMY
jgi:hypothetical protein